MTISGRPLTHHGDGPGAGTRPSPTSWSSWATISATGTSAPTIAGMMGYKTPNIDRMANEGAHLHRLLRPADLHRWSRRFHHRPEPVAYRTSEGRSAGAPKKGCQEKDPTIAGPPRSRKVMSPDSSARTISATATSTCPRCTASTNSSATSTTSMPRTSRSMPIIRRTLPSGLSSAARCDEVCGDRDRNPRRRSSLRALGQAEMRGYRAADQEAHGDYRRGIPRQPRMDFIEHARTRTKSHSSCGLTPSRMHIWTRLKPESQGKTGLGIYPDGMVEHDGHGRRDSRQAR